MERELEIRPAAHPVDRPATWHPPVASAARSADAKARVGFLQVEVGDPLLGIGSDAAQQL